MTFIWIGALAAVIYGSCTAFQKKTPLFYKLLYFSMVTCFMGASYSLLYEMIWQSESSGFHVGYLGFAGTFFFLFSSYYGAIDSLADGKEPELNRYRKGALVLAVTYFAVFVSYIYYYGKGVWFVILLIPACFTWYYAWKHLIIPDVEMGIIRVMRPYNAVVCGLCPLMLLYFLAEKGSLLKMCCSIGCGILLAIMLPAARNGVRKWFI